MHRILLLAVVCSLAAAPFGTGGPIDGSSAGFHKVKPGEPWEATKTFRAGERACVVAIGVVKDRSPVVNLEVHVFDNKNVLIGTDKATGAISGDFVTVVWYPPRDGEYRIQVRNPGTGLKTCWIAIK